MVTSSSKNKPGSAVLSSISDGIQADLQRAVVPSPAVSRPVPAPTQLMQFSEAFRTQSDELERLRIANGEGLQLDLSLIFPSPYQLRPLDEGRVLGLMANLEHNPLNTPIVVRLRPDGKTYETIAGHHRTEAFRRMNRRDILAVLSHADDDTAERLVFYDNLLAPTLCDYEKYLGFAQRKKSRNLSQGDLAAEAGISRQLVGYLLSFERLPKKAQELIAANPNVATANLFQSLAPLSEAHPDKVVSAVERVLAGKLAIMAAAGWVTQPETPARTSTAETVLKSGNSVYAKMRLKGSQLAIVFQSEAEATKVAELVQELLRKQTAL